MSVYVTCVHSRQNKALLLCTCCPVFNSAFDRKTVNNISKMNLKVYKNSPDPYLSF